MNITEILDRAANLRIAVVGDLIHDRYIDGVVERISPEAPVPILKITGTRENPGGAGNVVENLKALGCQVSFFHQENIPIKTRIMSGTHHILRMDDEDGMLRSMQWDDIDLGLEYGIDYKKFDAVILSDYNKGTLSKNVVTKIIARCIVTNIPTIVDTKDKHDIYAGANVLKCNRKEWLSYGSDEWTFLERGGLDSLVVTDGNKGMQYWSDIDGLQALGNIPGHKVDICDTCGAGDTVTAVLGIMTALGEDIDNACKVANVAAAEVCRHPGVYPIHKHDLIIRYNEIYPNNAPVQSFRLQSDATKDKGSYQADFKGADGGGDAGTEERQE